MDNQTLEQAIEELIIALKNKILELEAVIRKQSSDLQRNERRIAELEQVLRETEAEKRALESELENRRGY